MHVCSALPQQRHRLAPPAPARLRPRRCKADGREAAPRVERPSFALSADEVFAALWAALRDNDSPHVDAGVETLYSFADVDLYEPRSRFFGVKQDLGQFERFRRVLHTPRYRALLSHTQLRVLSTLAVSERELWQRVSVTSFRAGQQAEYCLTLRQQLGGRRDGWWLAASLSCDVAPGDATDEEGASEPL